MYLNTNDIPETVNPHWERLMYKIQAMGYSDFTHYMYSNDLSWNRTDIMAVVQADYEFYVRPRAKRLPRKVIFWGRNSQHRATPVSGTATFSYITPNGARAVKWL